MSLDKPKRQERGAKPTPVVSKPPETTPAPSSFTTKSQLEDGIGTLLELIPKGGAWSGLHPSLRNLVDKNTDEIEEILKILKDPTLDVDERVLRIVDSRSRQLETIQKIADELQQVINQANSAKVAMKEAQAQSEAYSKAVEEARRSIQTDRREHTKLSAAYAKATQEAEQATQRYNEEQKLKAKAEKTLENLRAQAERERVAWSKTKGELQAEKTNLQAEKEGLQAENRRSQSKINELEKAFFEYAEWQQTHKTVLDEMQTTIQELKTAQENSKAKALQREGEIANIRQLIQAKDEEHRQAIERKEGVFEAEVTKLLAEIESLEAQSAKLVAQTETQKTQLVNQQKSEDTLRSEIANLKLQIGIHKRFRADALAKAENLQAEHAQKIQTLQAEHAQSVHRLATSLERTRQDVDPNSILESAVRQRVSPLVEEHIKSVSNTTLGLVQIDAKLETLANASIKLAEEKRVKNKKLDELVAKNNTLWPFELVKNGNKPESKNLFDIYNDNHLEILKLLGRSDEIDAQHQRTLLAAQEEIMHSGKVHDEFTKKQGDLKAKIQATQELTGVSLENWVREVSRRTPDAQIDFSHQQTIDACKPESISIQAAVYKKEAKVRTEACREHEKSYLKQITIPQATFTFMKPAVPRTLQPIPVTIETPPQIIKTDIPKKIAPKYPKNSREESISRICLVAFNTLCVPIDNPSRRATELIINALVNAKCITDKEKEKTLEIITEHACLEKETGGKYLPTSAGRELVKIWLTSKEIDESIPKRISEAYNNLFKK